MAAIKIDGDFTTAKQLGPTRQIMPFEGVATVYVYEEDFTIYMSSYSPLALNTAHPTISSCYLVRQSTPEIIGGQVCKFTRTYAKVPSAHSEPSSIAYNFIGFAGTFGVNIAAITGRERFTKVVPARIEYAYYRIGDGTYTTYEDIPILQEQAYYVTDTTLNTDYLYDNPPYAADSTPSRSSYETLVAASTEIVAQPSRLSRWMGNIIQRETLYIKAE